MWTPDGKHIVFRSANPAAPGMYAVRSDGSGQAKPIAAWNPPNYASSFSPDGRRLAFYGIGNGAGFDIFTATVKSDGTLGAGGIGLGKSELFLATPLSEGAPAFSPDGLWLAYSSNESGTFEVYVRPYPGPVGQRQVSRGGGRFPVWSPNGRELLFERLDLQTMAVNYMVNGDSFAVEGQRTWAETRLLAIGINSNYDLAPDGKRLAALIAADPAGEKAQTHLKLLIHFGGEVGGAPWRGRPSGGRGSAGR